MESIPEEKVKELSFRKELETYVTAHNKHLREAVKTMDWIILLRNSHPTYRGDYAKECCKKGLITKAEAVEFGITY
jgi:hypothetical protein